MMFCPSCGEKLIQDDFNTCPYCGMDLRRINSKNIDGYDEVSVAGLKSLNPNYYKGVIQTYKDSYRLRIDGGISVREYWFASALHYAVILLFFFSLGLFFGLLAEITGDISFLYFVFDVLTPVEQIAYILVNIPIIALGIRRMHDVGKSGWYILIPIYSFILSLTPSKLTDNPYR